MVIEFKRNPETGIMEAYQDGRKIGEVHTMGDDLDDKPKDDSNARS